MRKGEGLSIGNIKESLRKRAGKVLVVIAGIALAASGCAAPTSETKPADTEQGQENTQTDSKGNPDLDWKLVDAGCGRDCEEGELLGEISKACDGTTLLYSYRLYDKQGSITAIPNSPECGYTPPTAENSPAPTAETTPTPASGN
ncbi:hypothetical protein EUA68_03305 [TM7 phylum sp. oral taxon 352]|nr:hypothetical protein EUA75_01285 [TM7 phylum sp. oral taxon 353]TWP16660.1 hypothetical protein EUA68_03305 [TM7 phylum sp. oral taxon 352]